MSESEFNSFNDPALRAAVRGVWASERAPQELRKRITALCPNQGPSRTTEPLILRFRSTLYGLAAAAVVLLAIGLVFEDWNGGSRRPRRAPRVIALPTALATDLFARHDYDSRLKEHKMAGISQDDFASIGKQLQQRLNFPVLAAKIPGADWKFNGAQICKVGTIVTAHLTYELRGKEYLSLFSMPASNISGAAPGCDYSQADSSHHLMAGFTTKYAFYCVVVTSVDDTITLEEVRTIRDELRPIIPDSPPSPDGQLATVVLPH